MRDGEFVAIVGPSGCGKSTILNLVAGLDRPSEGRILLNQVPVEGPNPSVGFMLQKDLLLPWRTIVHNVEFGLEARAISRAERRERALRELQRCRLHDFADSYPYQLSGGMRQRAALARTLAIEPAIVLLDEPFSALDAQTKLILQKSFAQTIASSSITTLLITHDLMEAVIMSDRILVMSERPGRIVEEIPVDLPDRDNPLARISAPRAREYVDHLLAACIWRRRPHDAAPTSPPRSSVQRSLRASSASGRAGRIEHVEVAPAAALASRASILIGSLAFGVVFLLAWQFLPPALGVPSFIIPTVTDLAREFGRMVARENLLVHILSTATIATIGFVIGSLLGAAMGYLLGMSVFIEKVLSPYILGLQIAPKVAFAPLFIMWLGYNAWPKLLVTILVVFFPILVNVLQSMKTVDRDLINLARAYSMSRMQIFWKIEVPASMPALMAGLRIGATLAVIGVTVGELVGGNTGLGYLITFGEGQANTAMVFNAIVLLTLIGIVLYGAVAMLEARVLHYIPRAMR